jgi:hypothetical protein
MAWFAQRMIDRLRVITGMIFRERKHRPSYLLGADLAQSVSYSSPASRLLSCAPTGRTSVGFIIDFRSATR